MKEGIVGRNGMPLSPLPLNSSLAVPGSDDSTHRLLPLCGSTQGGCSTLSRRVPRHLAKSIPSPPLYYGRWLCQLCHWVSTSDRDYPAANHRTVTIPSPLHMYQSVRTNSQRQLPIALALGHGRTLDADKGEAWRRHNRSASAVTKPRSSPTIGGTASRTPRGALTVTVGLDHEKIGIAQLLALPRRHTQLGQVASTARASPTTPQRSSSLGWGYK